MEENMDDEWTCIDDDSSNYSCTDSDQVDSETEAELYSKIHYEENLPSADCLGVENESSQASELFVYTQDKVNDVFYVDKNRESVQAFTEDIFPNDMDYRQNMKQSPGIASVVRTSEPRLDSAKKQKINFLKSFLCLSDPGNSNESSKHKLSCKQNQITSLTSNKRQKFHTKNDIAVVDSSDSESDFIWSEQASHNIHSNQIEINLTNDANETFDSDIIYLSSSESDDEQDAMSPVMKRSSMLKNLSMPNIKMGESSKDLWTINSDDLYRHRKSSRRYHDNSDITCSNCNKKGHSHRACPLPKIVKCFVCGGGHLGSRCGSRICSNCYAAGHDHKKCWKKPNAAVCCLCNMRGHMKETCPDLWRRYHLSTDLFTIQKGKKIKQATYLYCWNCGRGGHFGAECPRPYSSRSVFNTWPSVISYSTPKYLLKKRAIKILENRQKGPQKKERPPSDGHVPARFSNRKDNSYFKPKNEPNVEDNNLANKKKARRKQAQKLRRINQQIKRAEKLMKKKDFPRTPKKTGPQQSVDDTPEVMNLEIIRKQKRLERNKRKRLNKLIEKRKQTLQYIPLIS